MISDRGHVTQGGDVDGGESRAASHKPVPHTGHVAKGAKKKKGLRSTDVREVNPNKKKFLKAATFSKPPNETFKM